jgi:hypothetical protein
MSRLLRIGVVIGTGFWIGGSSVAAEELTVECNVYPTSGHKQVLDSGGSLRSRLETKLIVFTIDTDQKRYTDDGVTIKKIESITDEKFSFDNSTSLHTHYHEHINRFTGKYSYSAEGETSKILWSISVDGQCKKVALRPMPKPVM